MATMRVESMSADIGRAGVFRTLAAYALALAVLVGGGAWALTFAFPEPDARRAVVVSAVVAFVVQLVAFTVLRLAPRTRTMAAWGAGTLLRLAALAIYALLVVRSAGLPPAPALLSFVGFLFVSMLVEPLVLNVRL